MATSLAPDIDLEELRKWIGRSEVRDDVLDVSKVQALAATFDYDAAPARGANLPLLWHWAFFTPTVRQSELGRDGHPLLGGFMPPVPLPRRMWAGGRLRFSATLGIGEAVRRVTTIRDLSLKRGKDGPLLFLTLAHLIEGERGPAIEEEQDIVYRSPSRPSAASSTSMPAERGEFDWREVVTADEMLLFRYSALTFNTHRIHYDLPYATGQEGYPGLVVQGPLIATLLMDRLMRRERRRPSHFQFRGVGPLFAGEELTFAARCKGNDVDLGAFGPDRRPGMTAQAVFGGAR